MRHYDDGGVVAPDPNAWTDDKQKQLTDWLSTNMGPAPAGSSTSAALAPHPIAGPSPATAAGGNPPPPPPDMAASGESASQGSQEPNQKVTNSHPGLSPEQNDKLLQYVQGQQQQVDKFGPDQQKAVMDMIAREQGGIGTTLARMGSGLADGIMQGVARAGNPGFQKQFDDNLINKERMQAETVPQLQEMNAKNMTAKQNLAGLSNATPLGGTEAKAAQFLAKQLWPNITPQQLAAIGQNPQALKGILPEGVDLQKALAEIANTAEFRRESLENQRLGLEQTGAHQAAETTQGAAKALESRGIGEKLRDAFSPSPETKTLQRQAAGNESGDHNAALEWAQSHPTDPRAVKILGIAKQKLNGR